MPLAEQWNVTAMSTDSDPPAKKTRRLGRYQLKAKAGEGASGIVFRAYDPLLDRDCAIKLARTSDRFYLDYFTPDGEVVHLVPNLASQANRGSSRTVDVGKGEEWTIAEPFGDDLLLLITTDQPLFDQPREDAEAASDYLRSLSDRLSRIASSGRTAGIALLPISTRSKGGN